MIVDKFCTPVFAYLIISKVPIVKLVENVALMAPNISSVALRISLWLTSIKSTLGLFQSIVKGDYYFDGHATTIACSSMT